MKFHMKERDQILSLKPQSFSKQHCEVLRDGAYLNFVYAKYQHGILDKAT